MSYNGKLTPLTTNVLSSFLVNSGLQINANAAKYMGSCSAPLSYTPGKIISDTYLSPLVTAINLAYTKLQAGQLSSALYTNITSIGSQSIPALGNSKPSTYTRTYTGVTTRNGFLGLIPYQAYNELNLNSGKYSDFLQTFTACNSTAQLHNSSITAMTLSKIANRKQFAHKDEVKLSRSTVMSFYSFTKIAASSDILMKAFFYLSTGSLRKLSRT